MRSLSVVVVLLLAVAACGGAAESSGENLGEQESMNTSDASSDASDAGDAGASHDAASSHDASLDGSGSIATAVCAHLASGPFTPQLVTQPFNGSEDFAFDGKGNIIGKKGSALLRVGAPAQQGTTTTIASLPGQTYGVRFHPSGDLLAAIPGSGKLLSISRTNGQVTQLLSGLGMPNGVYADFDGTIWLTEYGANKVSRIAPNGTVTVVVSGAANAQGANGIVVDASKKIAFYTEYAKGKIHRIDLAAPPPTASNPPPTVATIAGAALDGLVLDACGNLYALDNGESRLYRVRLDAHGVATAAPELLADFPLNVANAQFGSGPGWDPKTLYVTGNPGAVYAVKLGVTGAPVPASP